MNKSQFFHIVDADGDAGIYRTRDVVCVISVQLPSGDDDMVPGVAIALQVNGEDRVTVCTTDYDLKGFVSQVLGDDDLLSQIDRKEVTNAAPDPDAD